MFFANILNCVNRLSCDRNVRGEMSDMIAVVFGAIIFYVQSGSLLVKVFNTQLIRVCLRNSDYPIVWGMYSRNEEHPNFQGFERRPKLIFFPLSG